MHFALLGDHADGLEMARCLTASGRHELVAVLDADIPDFAPQAACSSDLEEVLANPFVELAIVASPLSRRGEQLRRALQSERHVLCVHPCAEKLDVAYEAALIRAETKKVLLPLLPDRWKPIFLRIKEALQGKPLHWMNFELKKRNTSFDNWDTLRQLGGEIAEISAFAEMEELQHDKPLLISGRFELGGLFQINLLPTGEIEHARLKIASENFHLELEQTATALWRIADDHSPDTSPALLALLQEAAEKTTERWNQLVITFESTVQNPADKQPLSWEDEIHSLELDDAVRRSVEKRRAVSLEYREVSEEVGAKGTMTLIGCGLVWVVLLLVSLSIWIPWLGKLIVPMLGVFLALVAIRWLVKKSNS
jgi:predicted dehydrogenase